MTYLSIDLDYWTDAEDLNDMERWVGQVLELGTPVRVRDEHHHLLSHINKFRCPTVINVDYHSDIVSWEPGLKMHTLRAGICCGSWANYITYPERQRFHWVHPNRICAGLDTGMCHHEGPNPFRSVRKMDICGWPKVTRCTAKLPALDDITAVGIAISTAWWSPPGTDRFDTSESDWDQIRQFFARHGLKLSKKRMGAER